MAKPVKAAQPAKGGKSFAKPSPGTKRKSEAAPAGGAARPAKKFRAENGKPKAAEPLKKLSSKEKRATIREKKLAHKKNWEVIQDAVVLWERLRPKETPDAERKQLVNDILKKVKGKLLELVNHHTASRVIQFCIKHGGEVERKAVMEEVRANIVELSKSKYGHFLVRKLINTAKKDEVPGIVRLFRGHVAQLLRQPYGADVITDLYDVASTSDRNAMCSEFYGKEFVLFDGLAGEAGRLHSLQQLMAGAPAAKKRAILQHFAKALIPIMEKALVHPPITHRLVKDYLECSTGMTIEEAVETLSSTGEAVLRMVHTHEGAAAACMVLGYGTPKDRKKVVRAMKGHVAKMAADEWGHVVLCMALGCVDDTALTGKIIVPEIKELLSEGVHETTAVRVLLQLLAPDSRRHFPPAIYDMLHPPQRTVKGSTGKAVTDLEGEEDEVLDFGVGGDGGEEEDDGDELFTSKTDKKGGKAGKKGGKAGADKAADKAKPKAKGRGKQAAEDANEEGGAPEGGTEEGGEDASAGGERVLGSSKKDPAIRRRELLGSGPKSLSAALTAVVAGAAVALVRSPHSCELVVEVARGGEGGLLAELDAAGVGAVQEALVEDAARSPDEVAEAAGASIGDEEEAQGAVPSPAAAEHVFLNFFSSRALRRLVLAAAEEEGGGGAAAGFAKQLWDRAVKGRCKQWVGTHAEKVLAALLHCGVPEVQAAAAKELKPLVKGPVEEWAGKFLSHKDKPHHGPGAAHGQQQQQQPAAVSAGAPASTTPAAKGKQQPQTPATAGGKRAAQGQDGGQSGKAKQAKRK
ncbi:hypothetical protein HXX76_004722 [Chlamydomonas incerta]|uniref:PUM-HD domain-containing protein n=1 Tax=Chlamydomonas incerta TaxID=51695 RepID=A0A835W6P7_CHLIN|eukprot:KAG2439363.1 hypothetical protein HXX76_004722 [Chlamydomonas incerta]